MFSGSTYKAAASYTFSLQSNRRSCDIASRMSTISSSQLTAPPGIASDEYLDISFIIATDSCAINLLLSWTALTESINLSLLPRLICGYPSGSIVTVSSLYAPRAVYTGT